MLVKDLSSIFLKKKVCLIVVYAFGLCKSQCKQTLHDMSFRPEEGQEEVDADEGTIENILFSSLFVKFGRICRELCDIIVQLLPLCSVSRSTAIF